MSSEPRQGAPRRGLVARGTRMPILERRYGTGCAEAWIRVELDAWVCGADVTWSREGPYGDEQPPVANGEMLPYRYAFVATDGTRAYARPSDYDADEYAEAYGEGFGLPIVGHELYQGVGFARTRRGLYVEEESLRWARGSDFHGVELADGAPLDLAWVVKPQTRIRGPGRASRIASRFEVLHVAAVERGGVLRLIDGGRVSARDVARAVLSAPPEGVTADERWVDVDTAQQVLVAYEGTQPVFATLVSTGRAMPNHETPLGVHRFWIKLATQNMDDLEREDVSENYSIEHVPWVQFFEHSNGFHAAFWHEDFGHRRSHGCVNLSPRDARTMYAFTHPLVPPGWIAVFPTPNDPASIVRVR